VVFGGSSGIGADIARLLEGHGAQAYAYSRSSTGTHVERPEDVAEALRTVYEERGRIDYIVVTAGVLQLGELIDTDDASVDELIKVNYMGPVQVARMGIPYLERTHGQLLLFTSSSYTRGRGGYSLYSSSKAAVVNLSQALAEEWAERQVRVNCLNPERTATPMRSKAFGPEPPEELLESAQVAQTAVDVLVSEVTGTVIDIRRRTSDGRSGRAFDPPDFSEHIDQAPLDGDPETVGRRDRG
jgi:2-C-methyl-D-erythritol 4-phosphate cytidylyltransferase